LFALKIGRARKFIPALVGLLLIGLTYSVARIPFANASERSTLASGYGFTEVPIALPPGLPDRTIREVNPAYERIQAWISAVGAAVALNDLDGNGRPDDLCLVDTRSDTVIVTPAPDTAARYAPFVLDPAPLPVHAAMAPMGCVPGDFNADGRMDVLAYYWGRTPILFMKTSDAPATLSPASYKHVEVIAQASSADGSYVGARWNTNAVAVADFDGDGHPDIFIPNYFPDSDVLDASGLPNVQMQNTMSNAKNAGGSHMLRWVSGTSGPDPTVRFQEAAKAIPFGDASGWTLGAASADLDGDQLPELYIANDFGPDHLLHNVSTPGQIRFTPATGSRTPTTPKSMALGHDSFKGMSVDFGDLSGNGKLDMFVSNITTVWGIQESNFAWTNTSSSEADMRTKLSDGAAPFVNTASERKMAWTGWGWDAKMADFNNSGYLAVAQADGFVKGTVNRWNWLQELAMTNDELIREPKLWPNARAGDDISGNEKLAFWVRGDNGDFVNISQELGLAVPTPTRGIAVADTDGDGYQEFAVARQWGPPAFYHNNHPRQGQFVGLRLVRPVTGTAGAATDSGTPAYGAQVRITMADGRVQVSQLDGGSGHTGKRSFDVQFGLGNSAAPVNGELRWRDLSGTPHTQTLQLTTGWHTLVLDGTAQEVATR
jgi:enediyne biosynthesis protein E4